MQQCDKREFKSLMDDVAEMYDREKFSTAKLRMYFDALSMYSIDAVRGGVQSHIADAKYGHRLPLPADIAKAIKAIVDGASGRPSEDEAWAISISAIDESETVVWTTDCAQAFESARPLLEVGDKIAARMAFKSAYERIVSASVQPAEWFASIGTDPHKREHVLRKAVESRLIAQSVADRHIHRLEHSEAAIAIVGLLSGKVAQFPGSDDARKRFRELRRSIRGKMSDEEIREELHRLAQPRK